MILAAGGVLGAWLVAWGGLGFTTDPLWWASLISPAAWAVGIAAGGRSWLTVGFYLLVGTAGGVAFAGRLEAGLAATALALWSWDLGHLWISRLRRSDPAATRRLARAAVLRSAGLCAVGLVTGVAFTAIRVPLPFWGLVGGAVAVWLGLVLIVRALGRTYHAGGEARGNRSSSSPTL